MIYSRFSQSINNICWNDANNMPLIILAIAGHITAIRIFINKIANGIF